METNMTVSFKEIPGFLFAAGLPSHHMMIDPPPFPFPWVYDLYSIYARIKEK
jgi:hypothetical protein